MDVDPHVDAASLRVVDLRRILQAHRVPVPSSARKAALIEAFEQHVRPALLAAAPMVAPDAPAADAPSDALPATPQPPSMDIRFSDDNPFQRDSVSPPSAKVVQARTPPAATHVRRDGTPPSWPTTPARARRRTPQEARKLAMRSESGPTPSAVPVSSPSASTVPVRTGTRVLRWFMWICVFLWLGHCWLTRQAGYCTSGTVPIRAPLRTPQDVWRACISPACVPCPEHGVCANGRLVSCATTDYVVAEPWQARVPLVAQALPLALRSARCVPDTFKLVLASELADGLVDYLSHWHGQVRCQRVTPYPQTPAHLLGTYAVPEDVVKEALLSRITESMDTSTFEVIWALAMEGLQTHAPNDMLVLTSGNARWLVAPHASMPLSCRLRLFVRDWAWRNRMRAAYALTAVLATLFAHMHWQRRRRRAQHVALLAKDVFERLQAQAAQAERDGTPREIPVLHLRDTVLSYETRPQVRQRLWAPVARIVQQNANVRSRQAQWHGEWQHVWEWMGMVPTTPARPDAPSSVAAPSPVAASPAPDASAPAPDAVHDGRTPST